MTRLSLLTSPHLLSLHSLTPQSRPVQFSLSQFPNGEPTASSARKKAGGGRGHQKQTGIQLRYLMMMMMNDDCNACQGRVSLRRIPHFPPQDISTTRPLPTGSHAVPLKFKRAARVHFCFSFHSISILPAFSPFHRHVLCISITTLTIPDTGGWWARRIFPGEAFCEDQTTHQGRDKEYNV